MAEALRPDLFLRQVNCLTQPERSLVEAYRVVTDATLTEPLPRSLWDALWSVAWWGRDVREAEFKATFDISLISIGEFDFYLTALHPWFRAYDLAVRGGEAPLVSPCPMVDPRTTP